MSYAMISGVVILFDIQKMSLSNIIRGGGSRGGKSCRRFVRCLKNSVHIVRRILEMDRKVQRNEEGAYNYEEENVEY